MYSFHRFKELAIHTKCREQGQNICNVDVSVIIDIRCASRGASEFGQHGQHISHGHGSILVQVFWTCCRNPSSGSTGGYVLSTPTPVPTAPGYIVELASLQSPDTKVCPAGATLEHVLPRGCRRNRLGLRPIKRGCTRKNRRPSLPQRRGCKPPSVHQACPFRLPHTGCGSPVIKVSTCHHGRKHVAVAIGERVIPDNSSVLQSIAVAVVDGQRVASNRYTGGGAVVGLVP